MAHIVNRRVCEKCERSKECECFTTCDTDADTCEECPTYDECIHPPRTRKKG